MAGDIVAISFDENSSLFANLHHDEAVCAVMNSLLLKILDKKLAPAEKYYQDI